MDPPDPMDQSRLLSVEHETHYDYSAPVDVSEHVAYLRPLDDGRQRVERFEMSIEPAASHQQTSRDVFGNSRTCFTVTGVHRSLTVRTLSHVRLAMEEPQAGGLPAATAGEGALPWEEAACGLRYAAGAPYEPASEFRMPSRFVPWLPQLCELSAPCFPARRSVAEGAMELMHRIHAGFAYETASTGIDTPIATVLEQRRGVCQDFAHVMIGALRMLGLAARYVSGYLLTEPAPGAVPMQGADASHAWVAVWCPRADGRHTWLELDPTNDVVPGGGHVRLAIGRDYADVAPLRGVIRGGGKHSLSVRVQTRQLAAAA